VAIPLWQPNYGIISSITNANPGVVTTASPNGYYSGLIVQFFFGPLFGMQQLIGNIYTIVVLSPTTFSINQNTTAFDAFTIGTTLQVPQVVPVGEIASTLKNVERNLLIPIGGPTP
jgi:hypothetical protein